MVIKYKAYLIITSLYIAHSSTALRPSNESWPIMRWHNVVMWQFWKRAWRLWQRCSMKVNSSKSKLQIIKNITRWCTFTGTSSHHEGDANLFLSYSYTHLKNKVNTNTVATFWKATYINGLQHCYCTSAVPESARLPSEVWKGTISCISLHLGGYQFSLQSKRAHYFPKL